MFSRIIDMHPTSTKDQKESAKLPRKTYSNSSKPKKMFSKKLKEGSLSALKEMIALQKLDVQVPASTNQQMQTDRLQEMSGVGKITPSAQVSQLFEKLVETLTQIKNDGIEETTFFLDGDAFSPSVFQGAQITITEYSTAPKIFNIQFSASPETLAFFETHAEGLITALREGNFGFGVNRLDTSLLSENEKHALRPIEKTGEDEQEEE